MYAFDEIEDIGSGEDLVVTVYDEGMNRVVQGESLRKRGDSLHAAGRAIPRHKVAYVSFEREAPSMVGSVAKDAAFGIAAELAGVLISSLGSLLYVALMGL